MGGRARPWEAVWRPCEAVRGRVRPCEAEVGGRVRPCEAVRGRVRPNLGSLIGSDRSHDKMWEAEAV